MMNTVSLTARPVDWSGVADRSTAGAEQKQQQLIAQTQASQPDEPSGKEEVREAFNQFVGQTFFGQLMKSMRQSVGKPAYFHGGRGEEIFQAQLDQVLTEKMSEATADTIAEPMFQLFSLRRS